jgi:methylmalonyl-CoA/ethylmalonyl-CoA epimerase
MEKLKLHHIGIATDDIDSGIGYIDKLMGIKEISDIVYDSKQNANLCMITAKDGTSYELISGEVVKQYLKKHIFMYHTCYKVDNLVQSIDYLTSIGAIVVSEPKEAVLFGGRRVAFLMTDIGMIELLEEQVQAQELEK